MARPTNDFNHLWNDLPSDERKRMMPYMVESQKLHIFQCRNKAILAHERHLRELDAWIKNLDDDLNRYRSDDH